jgi:hypothetical protein
MGFTNVNGVRRTRSVIGETSAGLAGEVRKPRKQLPVRVNVQAQRANDGTYSARFDVDGRTATRKGIEADDLGETIGRLIIGLTDAVAEVGGTRRQRESEPFLMATDFTRKRPRDAYGGDRA